MTHIDTNMNEMNTTRQSREEENRFSGVGVGVDAETAFGAATAGEQRNTPIVLLVDFYEPAEISGEGSEARIESLLEILDMKISALEGRVSDEHLDQLRRRRSALVGVLDSPVTDDYSRPLSWPEIQSLAFSE